MDRWEFYEDSANEWRWRMLSPDGEIVGASEEGYATKDEAQRNARRHGYPPMWLDVRITGGAGIIRRLDPELLAWRGPAETAADGRVRVRALINARDIANIVAQGTEVLVSQALSRALPQSKVMSPDEATAVLARLRLLSGRA